MKQKARELLSDFKGGSYSFGTGSLATVGEHTATFGKKVMVVCDVIAGEMGILGKVKDSLKGSGLEVTAVVDGAGANAPREDVYRIAYHIGRVQPEVVMAIGGGSNIDASKAACVLNSFGGELDDYFGMGKVAETAKESAGEMMPLVAVQTASSSAAHLTKYSNVTDPVAGQKKLIVDDMVIPKRAVFDYGLTTTMPPGFTADGALDGIAHILEVFLGATGEDYKKMKEIATLGINLIVNNLSSAIKNGNDMEAREALGLGTDLGGYSIMIGGTSGAHLTSFSLVDVLSHGRACAIMNPYYTVFFSPSIQDQLQVIGEIYHGAGYIKEDISGLSGRDLGQAVAEGMVALSRDIGFPTTLGEVEGLTDAHIKQAITAAKDPQLEMKLKNMPVPLAGSSLAETERMVDDYMAPILEAAKTGDFSKIRTIE